MACTKTSRLGRCEVCDVNDAKYACPRCEVKSCCLSCVQIHKKELECSGIRDRVAYKPLNKFTNLDLQSDYMLLEEMSRRVKGYARNPCKYYTRHNGLLPVWLQKLKMSASSKMINLDFMPHNFSRNKANRTILNWKTGVIMWHIEWVFPQANNVRCTDDRVLEDERLAALVDKYLDPTRCDEVLSEHLQFYHSSGLPGVVLLLKTECPVRFYELDPSSSLKANLRGKYILEFPTVYVVLKDHKHMYNIVESDDEDEESFKLRKEQFNGHIKNVLPASMKDNFLFCKSDSDKSDGEQTLEKEHTKVQSDSFSCNLSCNS